MKILIRLVPVVFTLPAIPAKDGKPNGNGQENNDNDQPGNGIADITLGVSTDVPNGTYDQQYKYGGTDQHPQNTCVSF
jgi:hypothetical protein